MSCVAYFSMEIALASGMPTYSGGLGVLAGDTLRAAADMRVEMIGVTLLHRRGYFFQSIDETGWQQEKPDAWVVEDFLQELPQRATVTIEGRPVRLRAWRYFIQGPGGFVVPVYLLDTDLPENSAPDRELTHYLYGGDDRYRLCQEVVLGIGGIRMLRALGHDDIVRFHMNEGHASLLTLALLDEQAEKANRKTFSKEDIDEVRELCVFTTHTPVPAGHDQFTLDLVNSVLERPEIGAMPETFCFDGMLNMTHLGLNLAHYINGVAKKHAEVSQNMFRTHVIESITNGIHVGTFASPPIQALFNRYLPGWRADNFVLRGAMKIPKQEIWDAHQEAKRLLIEHVNAETGAGMDLDHLTLGFARRAATYKRADLLFHDLKRLRSIAKNIGPIQVVYAGKAHPRDDAGKAIIRHILQAKKELRYEIKIAYLENYRLELGKLLTAGVDVWLNTPLPPLEASGTSGMKAALNGVPSLSILDGWWIEGHIEGITGWAIADHGSEPASPADESERDAEYLYRKLENLVVPLYYQDREAFVDVMRHAMAINGSFFHTQRMVAEYVLKAYFR
ncbi:MAG: alpha-glucan family phosphorylase [Deltaproteobacteria bacterium]|nr:alpha-glucan family phosphorylase [Deltaproteobacteria bacterium]